jgi:adenylate cyclase
VSPHYKIGDHGGVDDVEPQEPDHPDGPERARKFRETARRADSRPQLVATARFIRRLLPGDNRYGDALSTSGTRVPDRVGRIVSDVQSERPSAVRELGLGALQAWQALSEAQGRGRGTADVAILFTDIVKFSPWALEAGDEAALELLRQVADVEDEAISDHGGNLVKRLGDGSMSVFASADDAVRAALQTHGGVGEIEVEGHTPTLRAGVHVGRPRRVGSDYLGVDVNIAARVGECAKAGEVLVSDPARAAMDDGGFKFGRRRRLRESGAPRDLSVHTVTAA